MGAPEPENNCVDTTKAMEYRKRHAHAPGKKAMQGRQVKVATLNTSSTRRRTRQCPTDIAN